MSIYIIYTLMYIRNRVKCSWWLHRTWYTGLDPGLSGVQGCDSVLPGEKVDVSLRPAGPQLDSTEDRRSTMLERHSRLEAPAVLSAGISTGRKWEHFQTRFQHHIQAINP